MRRLFARKFVICFITISWSSSLLAQSTVENAQKLPPNQPQTKSTNNDAPIPGNPEHRLLQTFAHDEYRMWTSPFRHENYPSHTLEKYGIPFVVISAALIGTDRQTAVLLPNTNGQLAWSGRVSQAGASYTVAGFTAATYIFGRLRGNSHAREAGFLGMEAVAHTAIIVTALKEIAQRERPLDANHHGRFWKGGSSFPSGHSATSFAVASVFAYEYRDHIAVPITAYSVASLVAFSRLSGRKHWASDIFVGSSTGFLIGRYLYRHHHDPELPGSPVKTGSRLVPEITTTASSAALIWSF
jgi:membrane-associated phospholipid phosphatase